tara:strand:+ start:3966 stop:4895 length:930 start_codon:yes stop_codon:yes gene_type:complete
MKEYSEAIMLKKYTQLLFALLIPFVTSCAPSALSAQAGTKQQVNSKLVQKNDSSENKQGPADFDPIQSALMQMNDNLQKGQSGGTQQPMLTTTDKGTVSVSQMQQLDSNVAAVSKNDMNMTMSKGKSKNSDSPGMKMGMSKLGTMKSMMPMGTCMGKMCKMMMGDQSMMGAKPTQNDHQSLDNSEVLPGYKNAPHIYHLGEIDFFLDQKEHLSLNATQIAKLKGIKNNWLDYQSENVSTREELETKLWQLTSLGKPNWIQIKQTVSEIETINSSLRLAFIKLVGNAIELLSVEQVNDLINIGMTNAVQG